MFFFIFTSLFFYENSPGDRVNRRGNFYIGRTRGP